MMARSARYQARRRRLGFANLQQFDHALSALPQIVGARVDCRGLTNEARVRRRREADRPDRSPYGRIKAARCAPVAGSETGAASTGRREVSFQLASCAFCEVLAPQCLLAPCVVRGLEQSHDFAALRVVQPFHVPARPQTMLLVEVSITRRAVLHFAYRRLSGGQAG
jgi:hypothetical protein